MDRITVRIPQLTVEEQLLALARGGAHVAIATAGLHRRPEGVVFIYRDLPPHTRDLAQAGSRIAAQGLCPLVLGLSAQPPTARLVSSWLQELGAAGAQTAAALTFVESERELSVWGAARVEGQLCPIGELCLPGPGMLTIPVHPRPPKGADAEEPLAGAPSGAPESEQGQASTNGRWSRLAAAIGDADVPRGYELLARLAQLHVVLVGCGREGELVSWRLGENGVGALGSLTLVDGDVVQEANLGVLLPPQTVNSHKAEAVAALVKVLAPWCQLTPLVATLSDREVLDLIMHSDVAITCVDNPAARLGVAVLCARHGVVHLDATGGTAYTADGQVAVGGEVRVALPGSPGCVGCMERTDRRQALANLSLTPAAELLQRTSTNWLQQRPGSWLEVLLPVVGELVQELIRVVQGKRRRSIWLHYWHGAEEVPCWEDWTVQAQGVSPQCPVCSPWGVRGRGDL